MFSFWLHWLLTTLALLNESAFYYCQNFFEGFTIVVAEFLCAAFDDVAATEADCGISGQPNRANTRAAVFNANHRIAIGKLDAQAHTSGFCIQPGMGFRRKFAQSADLAFPQREAC